MSSVHWGPPGRSQLTNGKVESGSHFLQGLQIVRGATPGVSHAAHTSPCVTFILVYSVVTFDCDFFPSLCLQEAASSWENQANTITLGFKPLTFSCFSLFLSTSHTSQVCVQAGECILQEFLSVWGTVLSSLFTFSLIFFHPHRDVLAEKVNS